MIKIIQPYYTWNGHYKKYTDSLCECKDACLIYSDFFCKLPKNVFIFSLARVFNSLISFCKLFAQGCKQNDVIISLEFEPFTFLLLLFFIRKNQINLIQTIHSVEQISTSSKLQNLLAGLQRKIFKFAINLIKNNDLIKFVVHSEVHKVQLNKINQQLSISILEYPCDSNEGINNERKLLTYPIKILVFGMIRKDKGIYDLLLNLHDEFYEKIELTLAGKLYDNRILEIRDKKFKLIDKFLSTGEINELMYNSHFTLLPYPESYTGGAGPLRDSASFGLPVICSKIPIFDEINKKYNFCVQYESISDIILNIDRIAFNHEYDTLSKNAINFSRKNSWTIFSEKYLSLTS